jgi:hypothetical protein
MKSYYLAFVLFWMRSVTVLTAQEKAATYPFQPDQLLAVLPETPREWTLIRSDADVFWGNSLLSKATRIFQAPVLDGSNATPAPPGEVKIRILDTADDAPSRADFADFKPLRNGPIEKKLIGSLPAIVVSKDETKQLVEVLVASRFVLDITFTNLPQQRVEDWLRSFHFDRLPEKSEAPSTPTGQFRVVHVDELQPERNRSQLVSVSSSQKAPKGADGAP